MVIASIDRAAYMARDEPVHSTKSSQANIAGTTERTNYARAGV